MQDSSESKSSWAIKLARAGFNVFPILPNDKRPAVDDWPNRATQDPAAVGAWWKENPEYNIGIHTDGLLVVDLDNKGDGLRTWSGIVDERRLFDEAPPPTMRVQTQSDGTHLYYKAGVPIRNSARKLGPGIDVRGTHGYVLGPGSTIEGREYKLLEWEGKSPRPAQAPPWLIEKAQALRDRSKHAGKRLNEETLAAIAEATRWLEEDAPEAIEGEQGDVTTFKVAARLFDLGLEPETAFELMQDWNDTKAIPPWDLDELEAKVDSAMRNRQRPIGVDNPGAPPAGMEDFELGPGEEATIEKAPAAIRLRALIPTERDKWEFLDGEASRALAFTGRDPILDGVLYAGEISVTYGDWGTRKSFLMMDIAYHVAMGRAWNGRAVESGPALWVAGEGGLGVHIRRVALAQHYSAEDAPFAILERPINLLKEEQHLLKLIEAIRRKEAEFGQPTRLIVIDTLAAVSAGGNENGSEDMGFLAEQFRKLRQAVGHQVHINVIHHSGKDAGRGPRGHSNLPAGVDSTIEVKKENQLASTAFLKKQRDGQSDFELLRFEGKDVFVGKDRKGRSIMSQVIVPRLVTGMEELEERLRGTDEERVLKSLDKMLDIREAAKGTPQTAPFDREFFIAAVDAAKLTGRGGELRTNARTRDSADERHVRRLLERLSANGQVCPQGKDVYFLGVIGVRTS